MTSDASGPSYRVATSTDFGQARDHNEDFAIVQEPSSGQPYGLFILCDGMGGPASGEVASQLAAETIRDTLTGTYRPGGDATGALLASIEAAQDALRAHQQANVETAGMGCTVLAGILEGPRLSLGHVGDCRCYVSTSGTIEILTQDHSWAAELYRAGALKSEEEVRTHSRRHVLTRFLGGREPGKVEADLIERDVEPGERVLFCTDGLWDMVRDPRIHELVQLGEPADAVTKLIDEANHEGGKDNVTVILFERTS